MENNNINIEPYKDKLHRRSNPGKPKKNGKKGFLIFLLIFVCIIAIAIVISIFNKPGRGNSYIGEIPINGAIVDGQNSEGYSQEYILNAIEEMSEDENNKGIYLTINSPGGGVYPTAELYHSLIDYKKKTGRPVYTYMKNMAASGGYYIAMASDRIYANENTWTGSIGVIVGTMYDFKDLLDKIGVRGVNITSGPNKAMGSGTQHMTKEQRRIFQSLVDESYETFVNVVATGRNMDIKKARKLADGRIYTATQAQNAGLIDEITREHEALEEFKKVTKTNTVEVFEAEEKFSLLPSILGFTSSDKKEKQDMDYTELFDLIEEKSNFTVTYLAPIRN